MFKNENDFSSVDGQELMAVEGGIVALEYLLLMTIVGLGLIVGVSASPTSTSGLASTSRLSTATR